MTAPNAGMRMSPHGLSVAEGFEQLRLTAYDDKRPHVVLKPGDTILGTLTIGWGHTGPDVYIGQTITREAANALKASDMAGCEAVVARLVTRKLNQGRFDACADFVFNAGEPRFASSTLLKKINAGASDHDICVQFRRWTRSGGVVMRGLVRRREADCALWTAAAPLSLASIAAEAFGVTAAQAAEPEPMPHDIEPDATVEEHSVLAASKTVWASVTHVVGGAGVAIAGAWHWIGGHVVAGVNWLLSNHDTVASAAEPLKSSGVNWLVTAAGVGVALLGAYVIIHRKHQIAEAKT